MKHKNLAAAYSAKRRLAHGGQVETNETTVRPDKGFGKIIMINEDEDAPEQFADGGEVEEQEKPSILKQIMDKLHKKHLGK